MSVLPRTAVVIVHGIGEQKPLDTLRGFVGTGDHSRGGLIDQEDAKHCYVAPDSFSGRTYSRRLTLDHTHRLLPIGGATHLDRRRYSRTTHFYEYYWAYRFRDTAWRHLPGFLLRLLRAQREDLFESSLRGRFDRGATVLRMFGMVLVVMLLLVSTSVSWMLTTEGRWSGSAYIGVAAIFGLSLCAFAVSLVGGLLGTVRMLVAVPAGALTGALTGYLIVGSEGILTLAASSLTVPLVVTAATLWIVWRPQSAKTLVAVIGGLALAGFVLGWVVVFRHSAALESPLHLLTSFGAVVLALAPVALGGLALRSLGDAARYLSNGPADIAERESVRNGLIELLRALEERRDPVTGRHLYERVVLVGHSLGSVIAYDALTSYWAEVSQGLYFPASPDRADPVEFWNVAAKLEDDSYAAAGVPGDDDKSPVTPLGPEALGQWRRQQRSLQAALRTEVRLRNDKLWRVPQRWIVTDLVTVGSPLAHAEVLLAESKQDLRLACKDRLLSTSPPARQRTPRAKQEHPFRYRAWRGHSYSTKLHHAAVFAPTSWTNLYFKHDLVGGPLVPRFGGAIRDVELDGAAAGLWSFIRAYPHSSY